MNADVLTGLEHAPWPALRVRADAAIRGSNAAARTFFGVLLPGHSPHLDPIWPAENGCAAADFFLLWESMPSVCSELRFRAANGSAKVFSTVITPCAGDSGHNFLLQLFSPEESPLPAKKFTPNVLPPAAVTGDAALQQKLDCALQLARTVSLDLNNALTGVLAHASLLLGKAEPGHPWRHSLLEVEKSTVRAAEISAELATFSRPDKAPRQTPPGNLNLIVTRCADFFRNAHGRPFD